jgi:hypothetical protein
MEGARWTKPNGWMSNEIMMDVQRNLYVIAMDVGRNGNGCWTKRQWMFDGISLGGMNGDGVEK